MTIQVTTLSNGLRVATDTMLESESVVVGAWVGVGTRNEPWNANGVAHLVEHMMFKGTKRHSARELSALIEQDGGMMNAHTTREETAYYARVLPENAELAVDIIADMLRHSRSASEELARERQVIIQEIGRDRDTPEDYISELLYDTAYPKQKVGRPILGTEKVIANLPRAAVADYVQRHYHAANMVIVGAGKITHESLVKLAQRYFGSLPSGRKSVAEAAKTKFGETRLHQDTEQLHLILAFPGPHRKARSVYAASLLSVVLGGSSSSRLFQKVREERGLVYAISASHMTMQDAGLFGIYAGTDPNRVKELIPVVCKELQSVTRTISRIELDRAKAQVRADMLMGQESVMRRADVLGHHMLAFGKPPSIPSLLKKVMAVTVDETQEMAKKILAHPPILAGLGPLAKLEDYDQLARRLRL